jgi:putative thioredoxin
MALIGLGGNGGKKDAGAKNASPHIKDTSLETFAADVLVASQDAPVIVEFWVAGSASCKQNAVALEAAVAAAKGAVKLVRVDVGDPGNQEIARQLRVQSIPTVYAFKNGQPVDAYMGAIPDSQVKEFVSALVGADGHGGDDHAAAVLEAAEAAFASGDVGAAAQAYAHLLQDDPGNPKAVAGLAKCYLKSGDLERARNTLQLVRPDGAADEAVRAVEAELHLRETAAGAGDIAQLEAKLAGDPGDLQVRFDLALAYDAAGKRAEAIEALLDIVRRDRKWNEDAARKHLVTLFEAMGPADPLTLAARRKLSSILFS